VLASLIPGLRELKGSLAAGFLWLTVLWLIFHSYIPERDEATGPIAALYEAGDALSAIGFGIALSFLAYLIGSLSEGLFNGPLRKLGGLIFSGGPTASLSTNGASLLQAVAREVVIEQFRTFERNDKDPVKLARALGGEGELSSPRLEEAVQEFHSTEKASENSRGRRDALLNELTGEVALIISEEADLSATEMMVQNPTSSLNTTDCEPNLTSA
jgi:hypothetical protein